MKFQVTIEDPKQISNIEAALKILDPTAEVIKSDQQTSSRVDHSFVPRFSKTDVFQIGQNHTLPVEIIRLKSTVFQPGNGNFHRFRKVFSFT